MYVKGKYFVFFLVMLASYVTTLSAQEVSDSVKIHFRQGWSKLEMQIGGNKQALDRIADSLSTSYSDSIYILKKISIIGGASPEGGISLNKRLSYKRANVLFDYLSAYGSLPDSLKTFTYIGRDWQGLLDKVMEDDNVPYREEVIAFLQDVVERCKQGENEGDRNLARLIALRNGHPYYYMYHKLFPELRASKLVLTYNKVRNPLILPVKSYASSIYIPQLTTAQPRLAVTPVSYYTPEKPFYMALKTNMLYDALLVPNAGVEFYLGKNFSVAGDWAYSWWKNDRSHWYWRVYGGEAVVRYWVGRKAKEKPLTGHHLGIYGSVFTYDFEMGGGRIYRRRTVRIAV